MRYRKRPVEVQAFKFYVDHMPDWFMDKVSTNEVVLRNSDFERYGVKGAYCEIQTLEGVKTGYPGYHIIKDQDGEIYPCRPDVFKKTYEEVEESE